VGVLRFVHAHLDTLVALLLTAAYVVEVWGSGAAVGPPFLSDLPLDEALALGAGAAFTLSLALRSRMPAVPLALAFVALALFGRGAIDGLTSVLLGLVLMAYSVGAWSGGRAALIGALGLGALAGLAVLRAGSDPVEARDIAAPILVFFAPWLVGIGVRGVRGRRGDPRVAGTPRIGPGAGAAAGGGANDRVRELRELIERDMSTVILESRSARRSMRDDPRATERSLTDIEAAGTEALEETQRLTGLLLSPDGARGAELGPGLADVEYLAEEVTKAGLPVDTMVTGRPLPLTPDLDAVAYRVAHEALMAALGGTRDASADVFVRYEPDLLEIEVVDDGVPLGDGSQDTAGLEAVRKEVASLGGTLDAGPREGRGYRVLAQLPYEPDWG
jgi:hypothetical protein